MRIAPGHRLAARLGALVRLAIVQQGGGDFPVGQIRTPRIDHDLPKFASALHQSLAFGMKPPAEAYALAA